MKRTRIAQIYQNAGEYAQKSITVCGWVRTIRDMKNFGFIELSDGSCLKGVQVVFNRDSLGNYDEISRLNVGAALVVSGTPGSYAGGEAAF